MWCHIFKHTQLPHIVTSSHKYVDHQVCDIYGWTLILIALILIANVELKPMWDFQTNSIFYLECDKDASIFVCTSQHLIGVNCCVSVSTWLVMSIFIYQSAHLLMSISWQPSSQDLVPGNPVRQGTLGSQGNFFFFNSIMRNWTHDLVMITRTAVQHACWTVLAQLSFRQWLYVLQINSRQSCLLTNG